MAVNDIVSARISQSSPSTIQPQPPHFGIVTDAPGAPLAVNQTVLWDNALSSTVSGADLTSLFLDVIEDPDQVTADAFIGKTVLRIAPGGPVTNDPAGGTSREFVGTVLAVYRRRPIQSAPGAGSIYLLMKSGSLFFEDVATQFTVLTDR
jgi:hypothetical protein